MRAYSEDETPTLPLPQLPLPVPEHAPEHAPAEVIPIRRGVSVKPHRVRRVLRAVRSVVLSLIALSLVATVSLNWWTPPFTAFMLEDGVGTYVDYQYVSIDHISRYVVAAAIAHEDTQLGVRTGAFDPKAFTARANAYLSGKPDPSGSTIPQQLVKNIYLSPSRDPIRKGVEAILSEELSYTVPNKRIMELYLNYAQFGPKLFGICAASWYYFTTAPFNLTQYQADQLMGTLPDPDLVRRAPHGGIDLSSTANPRAVALINNSANVWMPEQLNYMGGWRVAVATIGVTDTATQHTDTQSSADGCAVMPQSVQDRIASETNLSR